VKNIRSTLATVWRIALPYFRSEDKWAGRGLLAAVIAIELALVGNDVLLNQWRSRFYNALQEKDWDTFVRETIVFCVLATVLVVLSVCITVAFGTIGLFAALRTGSGEAVQGLFPIFFVFLFLSAMALPLDLLTTDWFHAIASANPVTYLLQAIRSLLIEGWNLGALALGFGIAAAVGAIGMTAASSALKTRLVRT